MTIAEQFAENIKDAYIKDQPTGCLDNLEVVWAEIKKVAIAKVPVPGRTENEDELVYQFEDDSALDMKTAKAYTSIYPLPLE